MFFRSAYGRRQYPDNPRSIVDSILGNIGEPLRTGSDEDDDRVETDGEEVMELHSTSGEDAAQGELWNSAEV